MSGVAMMQDGIKHTYHSIAIDPPGPVTVPEGSRCCAGSRKVLTLLLASALLWVIVLDIMLVVYRSHHLSGSTEDSPSETHLAGRLVILGAAVAPPGNLSLSTQPPEALPSSNGSEAAAGQRQSAGAPGESNERIDGSSDGGPTKTVRSPAQLPGLEGWLSRLRHRPEPGAMTSLDQPRWRRPGPVGFPPFWFPPAHRDSSADHRPPSADHRPSSADHRPPSADHHHHDSSPPGGAAGGAPPPPPPPPPPAARPDHPPAGGASQSSGTGLLLRLFSAVVDAPWNLTSNSEVHHIPPPPPPSLPLHPPFLPDRFMNPPSERFMNPPPERFMNPPPDRFMNPPNRPNFVPIIHINDENDSEDTIFDIDITE